MENKHKVEKNAINKITQTILMNNSHVEMVLSDYEGFLKTVLQYFDGTQTIAEIQTQHGAETYTIRFKKPTIVQPSLTFLTGITYKCSLYDAVYHDESYFASVYARVTIFKTVGDETTLVAEVKKKKVCQIPIMAGSSIDNSSPAKVPRGCFVVKGAYKQILPSQQIAKNVMLTKTATTSTGTLSYCSYMFNQKGSYKYLNKTSIISGRFQFSTQPLGIKFDPCTLLYRHGYNPISLLEAMLTPQFATNQILRLNLLRLIEPVSEVESIAAQIDTQRLLTEDRLYEKLQRLFLGAIPLSATDGSETMTIAMRYLIKMMQQVFLAYKGLKPLSVVDHPSNKRVCSVRGLLDQLFQYGAYRQLLGFRQQLLRQKVKKPASITALLKDSVITKAFVSALMTGNWGNRQSVTVTPDLSNKYGYLQNFGRVVSPLASTQPNLQARYVYLASRGRFDPCASGHGVIVGLVKSLTLGARVSSQVDCLEQVCAFLTGDGSDVYYNGAYVGRADWTPFRERFRNLRKSNSSLLSVAISYQANQIHIYSDAGRVLRPLLTQLAMKKGLDAVANMTFVNMLKTGVLEFLSAEEEASLKVATSYQQYLKGDYQYLEPSDLLLHDFAAGSIPLLNYNGAARITYGQKLFKQAMVEAPTKPLLPLATRLYCAIHNEQPLVGTQLHKSKSEFAANCNTGVNVSIAIMPIGGLNMDDAIVVKRSSIERGLYEGILFKTYSAQTNADLQDPVLNNFVKPSKDVKDYRSEEAYATLDDDGLPRVNEVISAGQAIVGRLKLPEYNSEDSFYEGQSYIDDSVYVSGRGVVKQVLTSGSGDLARLAKITIAGSRVLEQGDKLSSRYAQKGTIGRVLDDRVLPYSAQTGLTPDVFVSASAYPTRYTYGNLLETLLGKLAALTYRKYATLYGVSNLDAYKAVLEQNGFKSNGVETFINPVTGEQIEAPIHTGFSYYLRLQHVARDKLHCRNRGPVQLLTRQATAGKKAAGGLRFGEMQRDVLLAHGATTVCHERLNIDVGSFLVCSRCHVLVENMHAGAETICKTCDSTTHIKTVALPYAFRLLINEINALCIKVHLHTN